MGEHFSPTKFSQRSRLQLSEPQERGALGDRGRYLGKALPFGSAVIELSNCPQLGWSQFDELITTLEENIELLRDSGGEDFTLQCSLFHDGQCNFGFSKLQLQRIAALDIDLTISCYDGTDDL